MAVQSRGNKSPPPRQGTRNGAQHRQEQAIDNPHAQRHRRVHAHRRDQPAGVVLLELNHRLLAKARYDQTGQQVRGIPETVARCEAPEDRRGRHDKPPHNAPQWSGEEGMHAPVPDHDGGRDDPECKLRRDEPGPIDPLAQHGVHAPHHQKANARPEQRDEQAPPGERPGNIGERGQEHPVDHSHHHGQNGMNAHGQKQERQAELFELAGAHAANSGQDHAREQIDGIPETMAADDSIGQRRDRHHDPAHDSAPHAGGDRVYFRRHSEPIARHAGSQMLDAQTPVRRDRSHLSGNHDRFVDVPATGQQARDPEAQARKSRWPRRPRETPCWRSPPWPAWPGPAPGSEARSSAAASRPRRDLIRSQVSRSLLDHSPLRPPLVVIVAVRAFCSVLSPVAKSIKLIVQTSKPP